MEQNRYATKKKGKTEVYPFWNMADIKNVVEWFENNNEWDGYLITMLELLLGRRIGDAYCYCGCRYTVNRASFTCLADFIVAICVVWISLTHSFDAPYTNAVILS